LPVEYEIDHEKRFVFARAHGIVVLQELVDYFDAVALHDAGAYRKLFDARMMVPRFSDDDFMMIAARVSAYAVFSSRGAIAVVATTHDAILAARRYMNFAGGEDRPVRLFDSLDRARSWLDSQGGL
jgi:hypothetical protein